MESQSVNVTQIPSPAAAQPNSAPLSRAALLRLNDAFEEQAKAVAAVESTFAAEVAAALRDRGQALGHVQALTSKRVTREAAELGIAIPNGQWGYRITEGPDTGPILEIQGKATS